MTISAIRTLCVRHQSSYCFCFVKLIYFIRYQEEGFEGTKHWERVRGCLSFFSRENRLLIAVLPCQIWKDHFKAHGISEEHSLGVAPQRNRYYPVNRNTLLRL